MRVKNILRYSHTFNGLFVVFFMSEITTPENKRVRVKILDYQKAREYDLELRKRVHKRKGIYVIRIYDTNGESEKVYGDFDRENYLAVNPYWFDDINREVSLEEKESEDAKEDLASITDEIARQMIVDFLPFRSSVSELFTHCWFGQGRSAGTGIAFNELFEFGNDPERLKKAFPRYNKLVYDKIMNQGRKII